MSVIVTGGAGFIGSNLVIKLLNAGEEVTIIDNFSTGNYNNISEFSNKIKIVEADISEPGKWMNEFKNSTKVFHLAALADIVPSIQNPDAYFKSNVIGNFFI